MNIRRQQEQANHNWCR